MLSLAVEVKSCTLPRFTATSGVRQGSPLSPLLFAIASDVLPRCLKDKPPDCLIRAFADDTAIVTSDFVAHAVHVLSIFKEFAHISNLQLNLTKTVLIPLWESSQDVVRGWLRHELPAWQGVEIAWTAQYLGFYIGPERGNKSWDKACAEF